MKHIKSYNESQKLDLDSYYEIFNQVQELSVDFLDDLGLDYRVLEKSKPSVNFSKSASAILPKTIIVEITDTTYGFGTDREKFNSIVQRIKNYVEAEGCNFYVSRFDEHDNYYLDDEGYTKFGDYLKDPGNFWGFELRIF